MKYMGIYRGVAHDGDLQGRVCTLFLQISHEFFQKCLQIDEKVVRDETANGSLEEVRKVNRSFCQLEILIDQLLHFMNLDFDKVESSNDEF